MAKAAVASRPRHSAGGADLDLGRHAVRRRLILRGELRGAQQAVKIDRAPTGLAISYLRVPMPVAKGALMRKADYLIRLPPLSTFAPKGHFQKRLGGSNASSSQKGNDRAHTGQVDDYQSNERPRTRLASM